MSSPEEEFKLHLKATGLQEGCLREYRFHDKRRWRFDFAWPEAQVAVEIEGGVYVRGRHTRGQGFTKDCEKYSIAASEGWLVIRATPEQVTSGDAIEWAQRALVTRAA